MISNFKLFPNFNISQKFRSKCAKTKKHLCPELCFCFSALVLPRFITNKHVITLVSLMHYSIPIQINHLSKLPSSKSRAALE